MTVRAILKDAVRLWLERYESTAEESKQRAIAPGAEAGVAWTRESSWEQY